MSGHDHDHHHDEAKYVTEKAGIFLIVVLIALYVIAL